MATMETHHDDQLRLPLEVCEDFFAHITSTTRDELDAAAANVASTPSLTQLHGALQVPHLRQQSLVEQTMGTATRLFSPRLTPSAPTSTSSAKPAPKRSLNIRTVRSSPGFPASVFSPAPAR
jgi:hypothetical protein